MQGNVNTPANIRQKDEPFLNIVIFTSSVHLPATIMYYSSQIGKRQVNEIMTCNHFETIKRFRHFNDNQAYKPLGVPEHDKLFKVRPLWDKIRQPLLLMPKE